MGEFLDEFMRRELSRQITDVREVPQPEDGLFGAAVDQLRDFCRTHRRAPEPTGRHADEALLGRWLEAQKGHAQRGTLCEKRRSVLEEILGHEWSIDAITPN
ncbi:helicase associated domain-containing protein [Sinomonas susongensis]|uniref:helicase associated domain-containing protein n=1 Tax=Sinomonas susongensis TaxID=1324851 RepID=UPI0011094658|nr:helicase associated domain-containing protein [Sinomonas susongensis]